MRPRRLLTAALIGAGAFAGSVLYRRRTQRWRWERVDLYAEDGSMVTIEDGSPDAQRLLALAHELVVLARH